MTDHTKTKSRKPVQAKGGAPPPPRPPPPRPIRVHFRRSRPLPNDPPAMVLYPSTLSQLARGPQHIPPSWRSLHRTTIVARPPSSGLSTVENVQEEPSPQNTRSGGMIAFLFEKFLSVIGLGGTNGEH